MKFVLLSSLVALSTPYLLHTASPLSKPSVSEAEGICYDEYFCHGDAIEGVRDQWQCFDQGGASWWHKNSLNCSTRGR